MMRNRVRLLRIWVAEKTRKEEPCDARAFDVYLKKNMPNLPDDERSELLKRVTELNRRT